MDASVVEFTKLFGLEETYRELLTGLVNDLAKHQDYANHLDQADRSRLVADGARELVGTFAKMMAEKFQPSHLEALLNFLKTEEGHHVVFNLAFVFGGMAKPAKEVAQRIVKELLWQRQK